MIIPVDSEIELRQLKMEDVHDIFQTIDSQRVYLGEWLPFVEPTQKLEDTENFVKSVVNVTADQFEYVFTIRKEGAFAGLIGFKDTDKLNRKTEIGYWLSESCQKQGIITKSVEKLCDFAFNEQGMNRVQIKCAVGNIPSKKIPQRLGFILESIEREGELLANGNFTDLEVYSRLKKEWL